MRIRILLSGKGIIPYSYQYFLSSGFYGLMEYGNKELSFELHKDKPFKGFVFSSLFFEKFETKKEGILFEGKVKVYFSSYFVEHVEALVKGLLEKREMRIGKVILAVEGVEVLKEPDYEKVEVFETLSPVLVQKPVAEKRKGYDLYPYEKEFYEYLYKSIAHKYRMLTGKELKEPFELKFESFKPKRYKIKDEWYRCSLGKLRIFASSELKKVLYLSGIGIKNSMGFGMISPSPNGNNGKLQ